MVDSADETPATPNLPAAKRLPFSAVGGGSWSVRVTGWIWLTSVLVLAIIVLVAVGAIGELELTTGHVAAFVALTAIGGWGIAHWFTEVSDAQPIVGGGFSAVIAWVVLARFGDWGLEQLVPVPFGLGLAERLLLAPAVISIVLIVASGLRLHWGISRLAAALIALALFTTDDGGDFPRERVSAAGAAALNTARSTGQTIVLRGSAHDQGAGITGVRPAGAAHCEHLAVDDERRTAIGMPGRRLLVSFDACWDAARRPLSLVVVHHADKGDMFGNLRSVRLTDLSPFVLDRFDEGGGAIIADGSDDAAVYGDTKADVAVGGGIRAGGRISVFDDRGRISSDGTADDDTVRARVAGNTISVVVSYESRDPVIARRADQTVQPDQSLGSNGQDVDRYPTFRAPAGVALDVVTARLQRLGGSDASVTRFTAQGGHRDGRFSD